MNYINQIEPLIFRLTTRTIELVMPAVCSSTTTLCSLNMVSGSTFNENKGVVEPRKLTSTTSLNLSRWFNHVYSVQPPLANMYNMEVSSKCMLKIIHEKQLYR